MVKKTPVKNRRIALHSVNIGLFAVVFACIFTRQEGFVGLATTAILGIVGNNTQYGLGRSHTATKTKREEL